MLIPNWLRRLTEFHAIRRASRRSSRRRRDRRRPHNRLVIQSSIARSPDVLEDRTLLTTFLADERHLADSAVQSTIGMETFLPQHEVNASSSPLRSHPSALPDLPGLTLVDPDTDASGQIIFLDFDGAEDVIYNGPVTVGPFDVPAFEAPGELAGQEEAIISSVVKQLEQTFAGSGVFFTTEPSADGVEYSTVYIGGDDSAFHTYGSFRGLAEQVDAGNSNAVDNAFIFSSALTVSDSPSRAAERLSHVIQHETGHLLGYKHSSPSETRHVLSIVADAGNNPGYTAQAVVFGSTSMPINEHVGGSDSADYFQIAAAPNGALGLVIALGGLSADLDLELIEDKNNDGTRQDNEVLAHSRAGGTTNELIQFFPARDTLYYVRVYPFGQADSDYSLTIAGANASVPDPDLRRVDGVPTSVIIGEPFTVTITAENDSGLGGPDSAINASVVHSAGSDAVSVSNLDLSNWDGDENSPDYFRNINPGDGQNVYRRGPELISGGAIHHIREAGDKNWRSGEEHEMSFTVTPNEAGTIRLRVRTTMRDGVNGITNPNDDLWFRNDHNISGGVDGIDQQGWDVEEFTINVVPPFDPGPRIIEQTPPGTTTGSVRFVDVRFNEAINSSSFTAADVSVTSSTQSPLMTDVSHVSGNIYRISFNGTLFTPDTYNLLIGPNITDVAGNKMNQDNDTSNGESTQDRYSGSFVISSITSRYSGNIPRPANLAFHNEPNIDVYLERITSTGDESFTNTQPIQSSVETWVVIHGRASRANNFRNLAQAISTETGDQVLVLDWETGADDNLPKFGGLQGAGWIPSVADWATTVLSSVYGITGPQLRVVGHSWGSFVAYDIAENLPEGVRSLVALDPATAAGGNYEESAVDFSEVSALSWAFYGNGFFGSDNRAATADESFSVRYSDRDPDDGERHGAPVDVFELLVRHAQEHRIGEFFALERLENALVGPWREDQYTDNYGFPLRAFEGEIEVRDAPVVDWDDIREFRYRRLDNGVQIEIAGSELPFPPVVGTIPIQSIHENQATSEIAFTVSDFETPDALLSVTAESSNTTLVPFENIVIGGSGTTRTVQITPASTQFGTGTVTLTVTDLAGLPSRRSFPVSVDPVNDEPSFTRGSNVTVDENSGVYSAIWATNLSKGPDNESNQTLTFEISNDNPVLFSAGPEISATGRLTFTPAANRDGIANLTVRLKDSGGTDRGGDDTSSAIPLRITVNDVPPTLAISTTSADKAEGDSGNTPFTFTVSRSGDVSTALDATWTVTGSGGTPANADDFGGTFPSGPVHFDSNETTAQIIAINVRGDGVVERDEEFTVTLSDATTGAVITMPTAIGAIRNDETATISISGPNPTDEGDTGPTPFDFTVTLSNPVYVAVSVEFNTVDGTATTADDDYDAVSETITFQPDGPLSQTRSVQVNGDEGDFQTETFDVALSSLNTGSLDVSLGTSRVTATILNDDLDPNAGEIRGLKWNDVDGNGERNSANPDATDFEPGLPGWTIYIETTGNEELNWTDSNSNDQWDRGEGEQWTVTGSDGTYVLTEVPAGNHIVREVQQDDWEQTSGSTDRSTLFSSDFSSDPGIETNDSSRYFVSAGALEARTFTNSQQFGTFPVAYAGDSFELAFDVEIQSRTSGDANIGLFSGSRQTNSGVDPAIYVLWGGFGQVMGIRGRDANGSDFVAPAIEGDAPTFALNTVYHNVVTYNAVSRNATLDVSSPADLDFYSVTVAIPGGLPPLPNIGVSSVGSWSQSNRQEVVRIDNLVLTGPPDSRTVVVEAGQVVENINFGNQIAAGHVNEPPVNHVPGDQQLDEGGTLTFSESNANGISVSDPDDGGLHLQVTLTVDHGSLQLSTPDGVGFTVGTNGAASMTFAGASVAINTALDGLVYTPDTGYFGADSLQITTSDLGHSGTGGVRSDADSIEINVRPDDMEPPTADIVDVTPDPRNTHAGLVTINFSEAVTGVDISDFTLTHGGTTISLNGLAASGSGTTYTIDLTTVTAPEGRYVLTLVAAGSGIQDQAGNALANNASDSWSVALPAIDFDDVTIRGYAVGSQDFSGGITVLPGGNGIELNGNHWKAIDFVYTVTPNTILEFDFESSREGEIHGIGFDTDVNLHGINSQPDFFQLYGTQGWGRQDFHDYTPPDSEHYRIPVGQFLTGSFNHLVFVQDHDIRSADAQSIFQNVRVFED